LSDTLLGFARQMLRLNDEALGSLAQPALAGHVRVGTPNDFAITFQPRILGRFAERHPGVSLEVSCDLSAHLLEDFAQGRSGFDVVLAMHGAGGAGRAARHWREALVWVSAAGPAVQARRPLPLVVYLEGCVYRRSLTRALDAGRRGGAGGRPAAAPRGRHRPAPPQGEAVSRRLAPRRVHRREFG